MASGGESRFRPLIEFTCCEMCQELRQPHQPSSFFRCFPALCSTAVLPQLMSRDHPS
ncbi:hypothetical protein ACRRTK_004689 [Alexandromys fortis]